jgi:ankyrin repeat protein
MLTSQTLHEVLCSELDDTLLIAKFLAKQKHMNVNHYTDKFGNNVAHVAAGKNKPGSLKLLIDAKADLYAESKSGLPLHHAAQCDSAECVNLLLDAKVDVDILATEHRMPALHVAVQRGNLAAMRALIDAKASLDIQSTMLRLTAVQLACRADELGAVQLLVDAKADVAAKNGHFIQYNALCMAMIYEVDDDDGLASKAWPSLCHDVVRTWPTGRR